MSDESRCHSLNRICGMLQKRLWKQPVLSVETLLLFSFPNVFPLLKEKAHSLEGTDFFSQIMFKFTGLLII